MLLPNAERASIDERKLTDYCLSETHAAGKHKATVFLWVLGLGAPDAAKLRELLLEAVRTNKAQLGLADQFGQRYQVDFSTLTPAGEFATIRSAWMVRAGEDFPRLVSCYVQPR